MFDTMSLTKQKASRWNGSFSSCLSQFEKYEIVLLGPGHLNALFLLQRCCGSSDATSKASELTLSLVVAAIAVSEFCRVAVDQMT